ncbi:MAG TPA: glycosyltransferase [Vicinamibacterales bacterium]|nr:glycosyltransferase [Vicinamibacterales bacterium]
MAKDDIAMAFIGAIVPDAPVFHGPAFNRAGQMFQQELVLAMARAGLRPTAIFSVEPVPAFPRSRRLLGQSGRIALPNGLVVQFLPFVNIHVLKPLTAGLSTLAALLSWGWRHRGRPRLVHCINLTMPPGLFILVAARLIRAKATVSLMDVNQPGVLVPDVPARRLDFWLHRRLIPRFDGHMVASQAIAEDFAPGRRVCRIEGGVRAEDFRDTTGEGPISDRPKKFTAVLAGSLETYNGVELALEAFERLPLEGFELVVAGAGSLAEAVSARARRDGRVRYAGFLEFDEVLSLYRTADVLLNTRLTKALSTRHFFPSKLMEFMASGTPVISTSTGHVEEEFTGLVYLLRDETPDALAHLLQRIAATSIEERHALGRRARAYMLAHKTWERQGQRLADYLRREVFGDAV